MRYLLLLLVVGNILLFSATVEQMKNEKRYAFIIANGLVSETADDKAVASAKTLESFFKAKGFETVTAYNLDRAELIKTFRAFEKQVEPNGVIALVFSGRIVSYTGQSWMLPAAMNLEALNQLRLSAVSFNFLLTKLQSHSPRIMLGLIDGYYYGVKKNSTSADTILSSMSSIKEAGLLIKWNDTAKSSSFFPTFEKTVGNAEDDIAEIADKMARAGVYQRISEDDFYFNVPSKIMTPADKAWQRAAAKNSVVGYEAFLIAFPDSKYKQTATDRIAALNTKASGSAAGSAKKSQQSEAEKLRQAEAELKKQQEELARLKAAQGITVASVSGNTYYEPAEMVTIPEGVFLMGSETFANAKPVHMVKIVKPFKMSALEVSNKEYSAFLNATGTKYRKKELLKNESAAVAYVSWDEAKQYAEWLSKKSGKRYRLPTEAEWEYAARAGSDALYQWGDNPAMAPQFAWMAANAHGFVHSRGLLQPNAYGLFDMAGNVSEWCQDAATQDYSGASDISDKPVVDEDAMKIIRGGSYKSDGDSLSSSFRESNIPSYRSDAVGFRLVEEL